MFQGTIPEHNRGLILDIVRDWRVEAVQVLCSGNFTIERMLHEGSSEIPLFGNDITLYSVALGSYLAGEETPVLSAPKGSEWLAPYLDTDADRLASLMLLPNLLDAGRNRHSQRIAEAYQRQWPELHAELSAKVFRLPKILAGFYPECAIERLSDLPGSVGVISYPPTYAGGYERQNRRLEEFFGWREPPHKMLDSDAVDALAKDLLERGNSIVATDHRLSGDEEMLCGLCQSGPRAVPMWVYSDTRRRSVVLPRAYVKCKKLHVGESPGLSLVELSGEQFSGMRAAHLSGSILPGDSGLNVGVCREGKVLGAFAYVLGRFLSCGSSIYLQSDFARRGTPAGTSAVILRAALSKEAQQLVARKFGLKKSVAVTTAFTTRPESMKYRGIMTKTGYVRDPKGKQTGINYRARMGQWALADVEAWLTQKTSE